MAINYLYLRTSTKAQKYSLEVQETFLKDNIRKEHIKNSIIVVEEQASASKLSTRKFDNLIKNDITTNDVVYVYDESRLTRNSNSQESINFIIESIFAKGAELVIGLDLVNPENYEQMFVIAIKGEIATLNRKTQNAKSRAGIKVMKGKGEWIFKGNLYGFELNKNTKTISIKEDEANVVRFIYDEYLKGRSILSISNELNEKGIQKNKKSWHQSYVRRILLNPIYSGRYYQTTSRKPTENEDKELTVAKNYLFNGESLIPLETWNAVQNSYRTVVRSHARQFTYRYTPHDLAGLLLCGYCYDLGKRNSYVHSVCKTRNTIYENYVNKTHIQGCKQNIHTLGDKLFSKLFEVAFIVFISAHNEILSYFDLRNKESTEIMKVIQYQLNSKRRELLSYEEDVNSIANLLIDAKGSKALIENLIRRNEETESKIARVKEEVKKLNYSLQEATPSTELYDKLEEEVDYLLNRFATEPKRAIYIKYITRALLQDNTISIEFINGKKVVIPILATKNRRYQNDFIFNVSYGEKEQFTMNYTMDSSRFSLVDNEGNRLEVAIQHRLLALFKEWWNIYSAIG